MQDKVETNFLLIWGKALFLLSLTKILAGNGKLSQKQKQISLAACLVQLSLASREDLGSVFSTCSVTKHASHAEQFPFFPLSSVPRWPRRPTASWLVSGTVWPAGAGR